MKIYKAIFWRSNPQLTNGGYEMNVEIRAMSITSARKKARGISKRTAYGSMQLLDIYSTGKVEEA